MATTCKTLIEGAYARSTANDPNRLATNAELIGVIDRRLKSIYSFAARRNPFYFGDTSMVVGDGSKWPRPANAELMIRVESAGGGVAKKIAAQGTEIAVVPFEDRNAEYSPKVYELGRGYYSVGGAADPDAGATGDTLAFFYSRRHPDLDPTKPTDDPTNTLEADWPEQFNDLIVLHLAKYLSLKDVARSQPEYEALVGEEKDLFVTFGNHLEHENYVMRARWGQISRTVTPTVHGSDVR